MKITFIAHATFFGGAALSSTKTIQVLLDKGLLEPENCIIIHAKTCEPTNINNDAYYLLKQKILHFEWVLPWSHVDEIGGRPSLATKFRSIFINFRNLLFFLVYYYPILKREGVQLVHLNSVVLWPLLLILPKNIDAVIHIREGFNQTVESKIAIFVIKQKAKKIISIDSFCAQPFLNDQKSVIIMNPFNMSIARAMRKTKNEIKEKFGFSSNTFIISIVGLISEGKGQHILPRIAQKFLGQDVIFLVIGEQCGEYGKHCLEEFKEFANIKYLGQINEMNPIYAMTDVVMRLDTINYPPLGRTIWEGIFSGGLGLMPAKNSDDLSSISNWINDYIFIYDYANIENLDKVLKSIIEKYPNTVVDSGFNTSDNSEQSAIEFFNVLQKIS